MKIRFPLYARILFWLLLNFVALGGLFYAFFRAQYRLGLDSLVMGRAGDRIQAVTQLLAFDLNEQPQEEWNRIIKRYSDAYEVRFYVFRQDGGEAAGEPVDLPAQVAERLTVRMPMPMPMPGPGFPRPGQPQPEFNPPPGPQPQGWPQPNAPRQPEPWRDLGPQPGSPIRQRRDSEPSNRPNPGLPEIAPGPPPRFMVRTSDPARYWVGVRAVLSDPRRGRVQPMTLLMMSDSLRGGGLFFDFTPWIVVGSGALLFSVVFWIPLVRGITRAISQMTGATEQIAEGRFDTRVGVIRRDELGRLAQAINRMAARLAGFVSGQKRFLGDIAHELCSPIARMQMALGILENRADAKGAAYVADVREEVQHMSELVNELLSFSKAGLRQKEPALQLVTLDDIARRVIEREAGGAKNIALEIPAGLQALADPELLTRALANLLRNALRYGDGAGPITIAANETEGRVALSVTDSGPGLPEEMLEQVFDPFFRLEPSRSRDTGGVGLGLAIVKSCVEACHGTVLARNRRPAGLQVEITLKAGA